MKVAAGLLAVLSLGMAFGETSVVLDSRLQVFRMGSLDRPSVTYAPIAGVVREAGRRSVTGETRAARALELGATGAADAVDYYLGETLVAPAGVDWEATIQVAKTNGATKAFLIDGGRQDDPKHPSAVYTILNGLRSFTWVLTNGTVKTEKFLVSALPRGRPRRIYWTNPPYNGPPVEFSEQHTAQLFGDPNGVLKVEMDEMGNVTYGLHYNPSNRTLVAVGSLERPLRGQAVIAYYDTTGSDKRITLVQVVQVCEPNVKTLYAEVGKVVPADGDGYPTEGLIAAPTENALSDPKVDNLGAFLYQHKGQHSWSPSNGCVFAVRPTTSRAQSRTFTTVWWKEADEGNVLWPFVECTYDISWPTDPVVCVRNEVAAEPSMPICLPPTVSVELMKYQDPPGHVPAAADGALAPQKEGKALVKVNGDDRIWFLPIETVYNTNRRYFSREVTDWNVGQALRPLTGTRSGLGSNAVWNVNALLPCWLRESSAPVWAPQHYAAWTSYTAPTTADGALSEVFPVTASSDALEVWWVRSMNLDGLDEPVIVPTLPQLYRPVWPRREDLPAIVFASQLGSANSNLFNQTGALVFNATDSRMTLSPQADCLGDQGTLSFWVRREAGGGATDLLRVKGLSVTATGDRFTFAVGANQREFDIACSNRWRHAAVVRRNAKAEIYVDGTSVGDVPVPVGFGLGGADNQESYVGGKTVPGWELAEIKVFSSSLSAAEVENARYNLPSDGAQKPNAYWSFFGDAVVLVGDGSYAVVEQTSCFPYEATGVFVSEPGPPAYGCVIFPAESSPAVYVQNDERETGFNPNEEHATIARHRDGYVAYAARNDLNAEYGKSEPIVLVRYLLGAEQRMQALNVKMTDAIWPKMAGTAEAGQPFPGPYPFSEYVDPWNEQTTWTNLRLPDDGGSCVYRDRTLRLWPRAAGQARVAYHYPLQAGFYMKQASGGGLVPEGTVVGWGTNTWDWTVGWPTSGYLTMEIGRTLTTAANGLPEVWGASSMDIIHPESKSLPERADDAVAVLWDPTVARVVCTGLTGEWYSRYGLEFGESKDVSLRQGRYYINGAPPSIGNRLYVEPSNGTMYLSGEKNSDGILFPNFVTSEERQSLKKIVQNSDWHALVDKLPTTGLLPNRTLITPDSGQRVYTEYRPVDHYALTTLGGTNWIVLVENDGPKDMVSPGSTVSLRIILVTNSYYTARVITQQDPNDKLSQRLSVLYAESFAGYADRFKFFWQSTTPPDNGRVPRPGQDGFSDNRSGVGLTRFTLGEKGANLSTLVDTYYTVRYQAADDSVPYKTMGERYSEWADPPALAEGWLKRCLNNVTPFTQRMDDLVNNGAETAVSMIRQAGAPYEGDVALNQANLTSVGLIQLYTTLLNRGEVLAYAGTAAGSVDVNRQLQLAVERLTELYTVLGDEAWADALNPTIGFGSNFGEIESGLTIDYGALSSKLFCFDNQVSSLLDEELALLRGRSGADAPSTQLSPCFNRLTWNFTRGLTDGEVAYAVNYDISGLNATTIGYEQAREAYPQGHGDAYGHYLSALMPWYRLLRHPKFDWPKPAKETMNVGINVVNVRYLYESKFATAAANLARTAARVVETTARAAWRDNGETGTGARDANTTNAFGYAEFANRGAYGALCNWVVANSLLPVDRTVATNVTLTGEYEDLGLERIDRGTTDELVELCTQAEAIQTTLDRMDSGFNPLGLSENAVPFDISPIGATDGTKTHYEQIADRAQVALDNAQKVLDEAQESASRLRLVSEAESGITEAMQTLENDYDAQLVAIYGKPYADDIGPTGTYKQGYDGPDLYHYMWMDLEPYGITVTNGSVQTYKVNVVSTTDSDAGLSNTNQYSDVLADGATVTYSIMPSGIIVKPSNIRGSRKANGTIQLAYADFLAAYARFSNAATTYKAKAEQTKTAYDQIARQLSIAASDRTTITNYQAQITYWQKYKAKIDTAKEELEVILNGTASLFLGNIVEYKENLATLISGQDGAARVLMALYTAFEIANSVQTIGTLAGSLNKQLHELDEQLKLSQYETGLNAATAAYDQWNKAVEAISSLNSAVEALENARADLAAATERISAQIEAGNQALSGRTLARKRAVNNVAKLRYNDMFFRLTRNEALTRYAAAFDIAQRYTYLAAAAYGYDSGLMDATSGAEFLRSIAAERSLGALQEAKAKMDANWPGIKGGLGLNNPQPYATWFSLRQELFRVLPTAAGDAAWRQVLQQHYVSDLSLVPEYKRLCQPVSSDALATKEPGFVFPFETTIEFAKNFFGRPIVEGDHGFDVTYFSTKIKAAGVWLEGYSPNMLGANPVCYLVPAGEDRQRVPGLGMNEYASWSVLDQVVPLPYAIGETELSESTWFPTYDGQTGGADTLARIRRYPSFRAYYGPCGEDPDDGALDSPRLVGRSVWNTRWVLVFPAGAMLSDREKACDRFISTVSDIKLGLKTYSNSGTIQ